jgi:hypothetical protein
MAVAVTALVVALGGTGYAATELPAKSVGRKQLRDGSVGPKTIRANAVTGTQIAPGAVTGSEVRDGALTLRDLAKGTVPTSERTVVRSARGEPVAPGQLRAVAVACGPGERMTGGGGTFDGPPALGDRLVDSIPAGTTQPQTGWRVTLFNGGDTPRTGVAYAICAGR